MYMTEGGKAEVVWFAAAAAGTAAAVEILVAESGRVAVVDGVGRHSGCFPQHEPALGQAWQRFHAGSHYVHPRRMKTAPEWLPFFPEQSLLS